MDLSTWEPGRLIALGAVGMVALEVAAYMVVDWARRNIGHHGPTPRMGG